MLMQFFGQIVHYQFTQEQKNVSRRNHFLRFRKRKRDFSIDSKERSELINLMLDAKNKGMKTQLPKKKENGHYHCDTLGEYCKESHYKYN